MKSGNDNGMESGGIATEKKQSKALHTVFSWLSEQKFTINARALSNGQKSKQGSYHYPVNIITAIPQC
jgi:hypothetical protein